MSGILDEKERERLRKHAEESQNRFLDVSRGDVTGELKALRNEIRYFVDALKLNKYEFVAALEKLYGTRDLRLLSKDQLEDVRNDLKGREALGSLELEQIDREVKEILEGQDPGQVALEGSKPLKGTSGELVPAVQAAVVPVIDEAAAIEHFQRFQALKRAVLTDADYLFLDKNGRPCEKGASVAQHIKKDGWRKIALMFNIRVELLGRDRIQGVDASGDWHGWLYKVRAIAPNGRFQDAEGACTTRNAFFCKRTDKQSGAVTWIDTDEKNLICTAQTVAINRAISDLVGSGELSAEEIE